VDAPQVFWELLLVCHFHVVLLIQSLQGSKALGLDFVAAASCGAMYVLLLYTFVLGLIGCDVPSDAVETTIWNSKTIELSATSCTSGSQSHICEGGFIRQVSIVVKSRDAWNLRMANVSLFPQSKGNPRISEISKKGTCFLFFWALQLSKTEDKSKIKVTTRDSMGDSISTFSSGGNFDDCFTTDGYTSHKIGDIFMPKTELSVTISCHNCCSSCPVAWS